MYCEQCGAKILPGSRFCEECGAPVDYTEEKVEVSFEEDGSVFEKPDWADRWRGFTPAKGYGCYGLIITDTSHSNDIGQFMETLYDYIYWSANRRGIHYQLLDLKTQKVTQHIDSQYDIVNCLKGIASVARPDFQLIIGDAQVIPTFSFENLCEDGDEDVQTDLPYCTLRAKNLFEGMESFSLDGFIPTGRIPASDRDGFSLASDYFVNVMSSYEKQFTGPSLGVSALVWSDESNAIYSGIAGEPVLESPPVEKETSISSLMKSNAPGILYFNLHGSDQTEFWYGQEGWSYPEAVSPESFKGLESGYVVGVEACYGAAYDGRDDSESIVKTVLRGGCSALLGSSMIAYGTSCEPGSCADIMVGRFLTGIKNGMSVADSYLDGIKGLLNTDLDDAEIKTLQEFALYGDPSLGSEGVRTESIRSNSLSIQIPDIRKATTEALDKVNDKIAKTISKQISKYVYAKYKFFKHVEPEIISGNGKYQSVFKKNQNNLKHVLKVYYNSEGKVIRELVSK